MKNLITSIMDGLFPKETFDAYEYVGKHCFCKIAGKELFFKVSLYTPDDSLYVEGVEVSIFNFENIIDKTLIVFSHVYKEEFYFKKKRGDLIEASSRKTDYKPIREAIVGYFRVFAGDPAL